MTENTTHQTKSPARRPGHLRPSRPRWTPFSPISPGRPAGWRCGGRGTQLGADGVQTRSVPPVGEVAAGRRQPSGGGP